MSEYVVVQPTPDSELLASTGPAIPVEDLDKAKGGKKHVEAGSELTDREEAKDDEKEDENSASFAKSPAKPKPVDGSPAK